MSTNNPQEVSTEHIRNQTNTTESTNTQPQRRKLPPNPNFFSVLKYAELDYI
jgi:hypothetical protein